MDQIAPVLNLNLSAHGMQLVGAYGSTCDLCFDRVDFGAEICLPYLETH